MTRRVLIVCPAFPPLSTPDLQRVRMSLPHYPAAGWEPTVLTVDPALQDGAREEDLRETVPAEIRIVRCGALPLRLSRLLGIGNLGLRAWWQLFFTGSRLLRDGRFDLVFFSTTQFAVLPLGRLWRRRFGIPYVVDLQDPWRTDYYERPGVRKPPGGWKYQVARFQARMLEGWTFRRMAGLISVSEAYLRDLRARYPWFGSIPTAVVPFGTSRIDLDCARRLGPSPAARAASAPVRLVYTGAAGPVTPHAVTVLFGALARLRQEAPEQALRLRLEFIGTSYAPAEKAVPTVLPLAIAAGVADLVHERPARMGYLETLRIQQASDVLLLLGSSDRAYSPSKLYPYLLSGRPILSLVFSDSVLASILQELNCPMTVTLDEAAGVEAATRALCTHLRAVAEAAALPLPVTPLGASFEERFLAPALTRRQAALFERALDHHEHAVH